MPRATLKLGRGWQRRLALVQQWKKKTGGAPLPPEQLDELLPEPAPQQKPAGGRRKGVR